MAILLARAKERGVSPEATWEWRMTITWLAVLACVSLLVFLLFYRASPKDSGSLSRLALLHGVQRLRGESEESLRQRTIAASRWPYSYPEARFVWWARAWRRMTRGIRRR
ncbi:MAG: hypothetical protein AUI48_11400 [Chloroflexi bacterium 13_1_40CM_2_68_14]|nr:MAG: hypothetical protein AUI48_11400 [Chloroflexi bacterium 13_1_40CM_2_68_14]